MCSRLQLPHRLTDRPQPDVCVPCVQVTAGVLLCQGLVMAWLAARRKMLPDEVGLGLGLGLG